MFKVKHARTADAVVAGFRYHKSGPVVGSLLLGLYDDDGVLHHVGVSASFTAARRKELVDELAPYREDPPTDHPWAAWADGTGARAGGSGCPARSAAGPARRTSRWEPLRPELVVEVGYDAMEGDRFRHTAQFKRWRPDRDATVVHVRPARPSGPVRRRRRTGGAARKRRPRTVAGRADRCARARHRPSLRRAGLRRACSAVAGRPAARVGRCAGRARRGRERLDRLRARWPGSCSAGAARPITRYQCAHGQGAAGLEQPRRRQHLRHRA